MPRKKKDGRHINYYIDREIYERLVSYADDRGQQMTTAIERILKEHLDKYESDKHGRGGHVMFCPACNILIKGSRCTVCGRKNIREPIQEDYCYLVEKDVIWAGALSEILTQHGIPFVTKNILGAGLAAKMGPALERTRFYVPYANYQTARELENEFFSSGFSEND